MKSTRMPRTHTHTYCGFASDTESLFNRSTRTCVEKSGRKNFKFHLAACQKHCDTHKIWNTQNWFDKRKAKKTPKIDNKKREEKYNTNNTTAPGSLFLCDSFSNGIWVVFSLIPSIHRKHEKFFYYCTFFFTGFDHEFESRKSEALAEMVGLRFVKKWKSIYIVRRKLVKANFNIHKISVWQYDK